MGHEDGYEFDIHEYREHTRAMLELSIIDHVNTFDLAIDKLIDELKTSIVQLQKQLDKESEHSSEQQLIALDLMFNEEKLSSLVETKIIYAFKTIEIKIKKILKISFSPKSSREFYRWNYLIKFLEEKNINIKNLCGYQEVEELRKVNNIIKHNNDFANNLQSIPELKNVHEFELVYNKLNAFYKRIKQPVNIFLEELVSAIYDELYKFDVKKKVNAKSKTK